MPELLAGLGGCALLLPLALFQLPNSLSFSDDTSE